MTNDFIIPPKILSIITTYQCTSACENCCFQSTPQRKERLSVSEIKNYVSEVCSAYKSIKGVVLTGGECFLFGNKLIDIIKHIKTYNVYVRVITNGFWASNLEIANNKIRVLKEAGLNEINFSTGDDHLKYVSIDTIKNGIIASVNNNLITAVNVESSPTRTFDSNTLSSDKDLKSYVKDGRLIIINGIWVPMKNESLKELEDAQEKNFKAQNIEKRCSNIFETITIDPNHRMTACCGLTSKNIRFLDLGDSRKNIKSLYEKQFSDFLKIWIATDGPHYILNFACEHLNYEINTNSIHACQLCELLFNNKEILDVLKKEYKSQMARVILNYSLIKTQILKNENTK